MRQCDSCHDFVNRVYQDFDHKGKRCGVLCKVCRRLLKLADRDPKILRRWADYLKR